MKTITIIVHGRHGLNPLLKDFVHAYDQHKDITLTVKTTQKSGDAKVFAQEETANQTNIIIAAGGDGTINEVINGILPFAGKKPSLCVIPVGTGNDFMQNRKLFTSAHELFESIMREEGTKLDVGSIEANQKQHFFLNVADVGFGGATVHTLNKQRRFISGKIAYPIAILTTFFRFRKPLIEFKSPNFNYKGKALMVAFCNSSSFGSGIYIHPGANPSDQIMNITLLGKVSLFDYLRYLPKLKQGKRIDHPELHYFTANEAQIKIVNGSAPIEADGEPVHFNDSTIRLIPAAIKLIEPQQ